MSDTSIAIIPRESALEVFTAQDGMKPYLDKIRAEIDAFRPDITTVSGRQAVASIAYKVAKSKTYLDGIGKDLADLQKEIPKKIDAARKLVRDTLDQWKDEVRKPLTDWEQAEETRVYKLQQRLENLCQFPVNLDGSAVALANMLELLQATVIDDTWQEFKAKAAEAKAHGIKTMEAAVATAVKRERDEAELIRLRAEAATRLRREQEERIAAEAADKARREAEERAAAAAVKAEREAAEKLAAAERSAREQRDAAERKAKQEADAAAKREADLKRQREQAGREKQEAEQARKEAEERAVIAEQQARLKAIRELQDKIAAEQAAAAKREANKTHQTRINRAALAALVEGGVPEAAAKQALILIAGRKVPAVSIAY